MKQNTHQKALACLQSLLCMILVIVALLFCIFTPLYSIKFSDSNPDAGNLESFEVTAYPTVRALTRALIVMIKSEAKTVGSPLPEALSEEDLAIVNSAHAVMTELFGPEPFSNKSGTWKDDVFSYDTIALIALSIAILLLLLVPAVCAVGSIVCIVQFIQTFSDPKKAKKMTTSFSFLLSLLLAYVGLQATFPQFQLARGGLWILILGAACVLLATVATRFNHYTKEETRYVNLLQGGALLGSAGFALFAFGLIKGGLIKTCFQEGGRYSIYTFAITHENELSTLIGEPVSVSVSGLYVDLALLVLFSFFVFLAFLGYTARCAARLSLARKANHTATSALSPSEENSIVLAVLLILTALIPFALLIPWHTSSMEEGRFAMVEFTGEQIRYFALALAGAVVMLAAEILISCLKKKSHNDLGELGIAAVWEGAPIVESPAPVAAFPENGTFAGTEAPAAQEPAENTPPTENDL
ncbi:MAG: hypothetical protein IJR88_06340 [Clostridia bacterium]|nr:hypothetical protein [Clostridia bacterium]